MEGRKSPTNNVGFSAQFSVESEQCCLQPLLQAGSGFQEDCSSPHHHLRSLSLFDLTGDNQAQGRRGPDEVTPTKVSCSSDGVPRPDTPDQNNKRLFEALRHRDVGQIERLLKAGADPNATCGVDCISACHLAALRSDDALSFLLEAGAEKNRQDRLGRTPLHLAAWTGNIRQIAVLLGLSEDLQNRLGVVHGMIAAEDEVRKLSQNLRDLVNVECDFGPGNIQLPSYWNNTTDHNCRGVEKGLPVLQLGWTALHVASARAHHRCARLLIAAGADPCARDRVGRTPLDVAGSAHYSNHNIKCHDFTELVSTLINANCNNFSSQDKQMPESPLHTAVELGCLDAATLLVVSGVPVDWLNRTGQTALHLCVEKKLSEFLQNLARHGIDVKNKDKQTVLHKAVLEGWETGVRIAIENGADITARDNKHETPIHSAAIIGNVEILNHIISAAADHNIIDATNSQGETALVKAVVNGHLECVKKLLEEGADITKTLRNQNNLFHIAAEKGYQEVLRVLLDHDYTVTRKIINNLTADDKKGYGPIHFAVQNNHLECVRTLLAHNANIGLKTIEEHKGSTPLHIAARYNRVEIAKLLIDNNRDTVHFKNDIGFTPLHSAARFGQRDMIKLLLKEGADLASRTNNSTTAIDVIMNHLFKPTEFMENVFDSCISTNNLSLEDANCKVTVDYNILKPVIYEENMKVIVALLQTGNKYDQRRLFIHPLIESFLYIKWMDTPILLLFLFLTIIHYLFLISFTLYIMVVFLTNDLGHYSPRHYVWSTILFIGIVLLVLQETLYIKVKFRYLRQIETWVRIFFVITGLIVLFTTVMGLTGVDIPRHIASAVILLSWLDMTFLQYHFHDYGYYVFMMEKVTASTVKVWSNLYIRLCDGPDDHLILVSNIYLQVLFTFAFLILAFCIIFMLQFKFQEPFDGPFSALVKVIAMMFSELDYQTLMKQNKSKEFALTVLRITMFVFIIFATIVTIIASTAVIEPQKIRLSVRIRIMKKRIEFLGSLELFIQMKFVQKILPKWMDKILKEKKRNITRYILTPSVPKSNRAVPCSVRESICAIAENQNNKGMTK
ncbi:serine/threonine-protein phosphatase 6 regulatory ankyrin repeat subunit C isoform X2 [Helicoverpa armigera]|uniref:serine/threonine-protein phosphatase 6 regulatory ankyrin repeat subunit C isoform X2 n=1 Tax=Helicoverpa armigera TaxID=29058 RepID=UPI003082A254